MTERIIELKWTCSQCDTNNILGRHKRCPQCDSPRELGEMNMSGLNEYNEQGVNINKTVTDPSLLELATAGYDWFCPYCESGNRGDQAICTSCGGNKLEYTQTTNDNFDPQIPLKAAPGILIFAGISFALPAVIVASILSLVFIIWLVTTHEVKGSVVSLYWEHRVEVERWTPVTIRQWEHETYLKSEIPPVNGKGERAGILLLGNCTQEHHHYEKYQCGTRTESYDCSYYKDVSSTCSRSVRYACGETCTDNKNGFATCRTKYCSRSESYSCTKSKRMPKTCQRDIPKYCDRSIKRTKCNYQTQRWLKLKVLTEKGYDTNTIWPAPELSALDRIVRKGEYKVNISYNNGNKSSIYGIKPKSENEFKQWHLDDNVIMDIDHLGFIHDWRKM